MSSCPTVATLEKFLLGHIDDEQQEQIESHLKTCHSCVQHLSGLEVDDVLTSTVRSTRQANLDQQEQTTITALIDHLQQQYTVLPWERKRFSAPVRKRPAIWWSLVALAVVVSLVSASLLVYVLFLPF